MQQHIDIKRALHAPAGAAASAAQDRLVAQIVLRHSIDQSLRPNFVRNLAMSQTSPLDAVIDLLLTPVPFLPSASFVYSLRSPKGRARPAPRRVVKSAGRPHGQPPVQGISVKGKLELGSATPYAVCGHDFVIDKDTWIFGEVRLGATAMVQLVRTPNGVHAKKLMVS